MNERSVDEGDLDDTMLDEAAQSGRLEIAKSVQQSLEALGQLSVLLGTVDEEAFSDPAERATFMDDRLVAIGLAARVGSVVVSGALDLLTTGNTYGASALVRQLVEVEYIAWACAEDPNSAAEWLNSGVETRLRMWQPRHIRARAGDRFRGQDYGSHCEAGGHPTPSGILLLASGAPESDGRLRADAVVRYELAIHSTSVLEYIIDAPERTIPKCLGDAAEILAGRTAIMEWRATDPALG